MASGIEIRNASGSVVFSTASQTWSYIDSFIVDSGYTTGVVREPVTGSTLSTTGYVFAYIYNNVESYTGSTVDWYWNGYFTSSPYQPYIIVNGFTYYMDTGNNSGWQYTVDENDGSMKYIIRVGLYRTYTGATFTPISVTKTYSSLSLMNEVIFQRAAVDNPPNNQEGYIHTATRSGNDVTVSGGNIRTLVTVLGR